MGRCFPAAVLLACGFCSPLFAQSGEPTRVEYELAPKTLSRSVEPVWSLAVSPDGSLVAEGNEAGQVILRNPSTRETVRVLAGHEGIVSALDFSPSGEWLASAGFDGKIRLWHITSGRLQFTLTGHSSWITALEFGPNGQSLASAGYDKTVRLWDSKTGVETDRFAGHLATVRSLSFSPDGQTLVSAGDEGQLDFWNLDTGKHEQPLPKQDAGVACVDFSPDGRSLFTVPNEGDVRVWDLAEKKPTVFFSLATPAESNATPQTARFAPNGRTLLFATVSGQLQVRSAKTGETVQLLDGHDDIVTSLAVSRDGKILYTGGLDGKTLAWPAQLPLETPLEKLPIDRGKLWAVSVSPDGKTVAVGGKGGVAEIWDVAARKRLRSMEGFDSTVDCLKFSPDGHTLFAAGWSSENLIAWNADSGDVRYTLEMEGNLRAFAISPDGKTLAVGQMKESPVTIYSLPDGTKQKQLSDHELSIYDLAFSPDGRLLASCSGEWTERKPGRVVIHDVQSFEKLAQFDDHTHAVRSLAFSPDGSALCSLSQDGVLKIYDAGAMREIHSFKNGLDARPVAFSPDGKQIAVGLQNGNINFWNLEKREIERRFEGSDDLFDVEFSRDGSLLFAVDGNEFVQIWKAWDGKNSLAKTVQSRIPAVAEKSSNKSTPQESQ